MMKDNDSKNIDALLRLYNLYDEHSSSSSRETKKQSEGTG